MAEIKLCAFADEAGDSLAEQIAMMKDNGIELLELRAIDKKNVSKFTNEEVREYKKQLDDAGIKVWAIGSPIGKVKIEDDFNVDLDLCKRVLEIGEMFGAKKLRMFSFYGTEGKPEYRETVIDRLGRYLEAARGSGIRLCHENEKGIYGDTAARCLELLRALPELRAVYDPANFVQCGEDTVAAFDLLAPYIDYGHVKDSLADNSIVPPGTGIGKIPEYFARVRAIGGEVLTLEPHLAEFSSLADIEQEGDESKVGLYEFANPREAFDYAVTCVKKMLKEI